jgi:hypothetical protein
VRITAEQIDAVHAWLAHREAGRQDLQPLLPLLVERFKVSTDCAIAIIHAAKVLAHVGATADYPTGPPGRPVSPASIPGVPRRGRPPRHV